LRRQSRAEEAVTTWSVLIGVLGVFGTGALAAHLSRRTSQRDPVRYWVLGLFALLPAWLIAFVSLLGASTGRPSEGALHIFWILSSSAALLGVIVTDAAVRPVRKPGGAPRPMVAWLLGVAAFFPAWGLALLGLVWT